MNVNELVLKLLHIPNQMQEVTPELLHECGVETIIRYEVEITAEQIHAIAAKMIDQKLKEFEKELIEGESDDFR